MSSSSPSKMPSHPSSVYIAIARIHPSACHVERIRAQGNTSHRVKDLQKQGPLYQADMNGCNLYDRALELQNLVNDAIDKGAEIAVRGSFGNLGEDAVDQFFPPTILVNVNHTMKIMQEAFGPILPIIKFSSDEEAIKLAKDSKFGLCG